MKKLITYGMPVIVIPIFMALSPADNESNINTLQPSNSIRQTQNNTVASDSAGAKLFHDKTCFTCHGKDGKTPLAPIYPKIAGQNLNYILQQMRDIKSRARDNSQTAAMHGIMQLVSDDELETLADYVSNLPRGEAMYPPPGRRSPGSRLFRRKTCFTCHGRDGKTPIMPEYPKIAGQNYEYALQQIRDIKSGDRTNGMSVAMNGVMFLVNDEEIEIVADYISKLAP